MGRPAALHEASGTSVATPQNANDADHSLAPARESARESAPTAQDQRARGCKAMVNQHADVSRTRTEIAKRCARSGQTTNCDWGKRTRTVPAVMEKHCARPGQTSNCDPAA